MISTLIVEAETNMAKSIGQSLGRLFPELDIRHQTSSIDEACSMIKKYKTDLVFFDFELMKRKNCHLISQNNNQDFECIYISSSPNEAFEAIKLAAAGFLLKPVKTEDLLIAVNNAKKRILDKAEIRKNQELLRNLRKDKPI